MSEQAELERLSELLPRLAMAVVYQCMRSPDGIAIDKPHLRHAWLVAKSVERMHERHGYWTQESSQALLDMQQAMLEALRLIHGQERGVPPEPDHVDREGGEWLLQRDAGETDDDYAGRRMLFGDGTGRLYRLRRRDGESDDDYAARVQSMSKVSIRIAEPSLVFEQVGFIEQDRRHLKSEIAELERKLQAALQKLSAADCYLDESDEDELAGLDGIKHERALRRAESNLRRHGTRVVATPDVVGGQPRIDGTRMPIAMLIIYLRSMTESEISREWSHLPPGWLDAIVAWIDRQRASEGGR